jgi:hypothetical protein
MQSASQAQVAEHIERMDALRQQLQSVGTADERQRLVGELRQEMGRGMALMHGDAAEVPEECQSMMEMMTPGAHRMSMTGI